MSSGMPNTAPADEKVRIDELNGLSYHERNRDLQASYVAANQALQLSEKSGCLKGKADGPKGVFPAASDYDQVKNRTRPVDFESDKQKLIEMFEQPGLTNVKKELPIHPAFGKLTHKEYARIVYLHFDHHLRQFGV